jgi:hypothetical protein
MLSLKGAQPNKHFFWIKARGNFTTLRTEISLLQNKSPNLLSISPQWSLKAFTFLIPPAINTNILAD